MSCNAMLEKDGDDLLGRSCERWRSVAESRRGISYIQWRSGRL